MKISTFENHSTYKNKPRSALEVSCISKKNSNPYLEVPSNWEKTY
jgi:hypothetical protein